MKVNPSVLLLIAFFCCATVLIQTSTRAAILDDLWNGRAELGDPELVTFEGSPVNYSLDDPGRVALVNVDNDTIYAYFRQLKPPANNSFEIYVAVSSDGGKTFNMRPDPIIPTTQSIPGLGRLDSAYDQDVVKQPDGYYMVFEGGGDINSDASSGGKGCQVSSFIAFSADGINNWQVKNVIACATGGWSNLSKGIGNSASVPSLIQTPSGDLYLQWDDVDVPTWISTKHQLKIDTADPFKTLTTDVSVNPFPVPAPGSWDRTWDVGDTIYENGYYYMFYLGEPIFQPGIEKGRFGIGLARTADLDNVSSWQKYALNPLILSTSDTTCWVQYPQIVQINGTYYLYWNDVLPYWQPDHNTNTIFRSAIIPKRTGNHAEFVSQSVPTTMVAGKTYQASVTMKNTGNTIWTENSRYRLGSQSPQDNWIWRDGRVHLGDGEAVDPYYCSATDYVQSLGGYVKSDPAMNLMEGRLVIAAQGGDDGIWVKKWIPYYGVNYSSYWNWYAVSGVKISSQPLLTVIQGTLWMYVTGTDGITYRTWYHGDEKWSDNASLTWSPWENLGNMSIPKGTSIAGGYKVYRQGDGSVALGRCKESANPDHTFTFDITAPATPGTYNFQWRMVQDGVEWFGDYTANKLITVVTTSTTTTTTLKVPGDANGDGHVNYNDLIFVASSYGRARGQAGFDGRADFNSDGIIDYDDLIVLAFHYGL